MVLMHIKLVLLDCVTLDYDFTFGSIPLRSDVRMGNSRYVSEVTFSSQEFIDIVGRVASQIASEFTQLFIQASIKEHK